MGRGGRRERVRAADEERLPLALAALALAAAGDQEAVARLPMAFALSRGRKAGPPAPPMMAVFPYAETVPVVDRRLSVLCEVISRSGLNGTGVYRRDDPVWIEFRPPRHWNCRCGLILLTPHMAASRGVKEAVEWVRSGRPPRRPKYVRRPPVDMPDGYTRP